MSRMPAVKMALVGRSQFVRERSYAVSLAAELKRPAAAAVYPKARRTVSGMARV